MFAVGLFTWLICAVVTAIIAGSRDRNAIAWFFIGAVIGIFGLILVIALPPAKNAPLAQDGPFPLIGAGRKVTSTGRECPDCRETAPITARYCPHCGGRIA